MNSETEKTIYEFIDDILKTLRKTDGIIREATDEIERLKEANQTQEDMIDYLNSLVKMKDKEIEPVQEWVKNQSLRWDELTMSIERLTSKLASL